MRLEIETKEYIEAVAKDKVSMQENSQESNTNEGSSAIISAAKESNEESLNNSGIFGMQATGQESVNTSANNASILGSITSHCSGNEPTPIPENTAGRV